MCRATASTSAGSQSKSGNPCDKLIAPRSAASLDMTVKIVVPTLGSFDRRCNGVAKFTNCPSQQEIGRSEDQEARSVSNKTKSSWSPELLTSYGSSAGLNMP